MLKSDIKRFFYCAYKSRLLGSRKIQKPRFDINAAVRYVSSDSENVAPLAITTKHKQVTSATDISSLPNTAENEKTFSYFDREEFFEKYPPTSLAAPRQAWIETLDANNEARDLIRLHPDIWGVRPRIDVLWSNIDWQKRYKTVLYNDVKDRYDLHEGGRPWQRKGGGRSRHRSRQSPLWIQGGKAHGPRGPRTDFYMLPYITRITGLIHALSAKFAQDDVKIVYDLELPSEKPKYIEDLIDNRGWAISTLFVGKDDMFPRNLTAATETIFHVNMMPVYGLNVYSMLKHKTLVLTIDAVMQIEEKLLFALNRTDRAQKCLASSTDGKRIV
jgi:large subunit ribosomal protein L4